MVEHGPTLGNFVVQIENSSFVKKRIDDFAICGACEGRERWLEKSTELLGHVKDNWEGIFERLNDIHEIEHKLRKEHFIAGNDSDRNFQQQKNQHIDHQL